MNGGILFLGAAICFVWGIVHIIPTRAIVERFGELRADGRKILTMEWVSEGLTLIFVGGLTGMMALAPDKGYQTSVLIVRFCAGMLLVMGGWTLLTGARTSIRAVRMAPYIKAAAAVLLYAATIV